MTFEALLAFAGALLSGCLGIGAFYREPRNLAPRTFALGMLVLTLREVCVGLETQTMWSVDALPWLRFAWVIHAMLPGSWLPFSLCFARSNAREHLITWRWRVLGVLALPLGVSLLFHRAMVLMPSWQEGRLSALPLGWAGYLLGIAGLLTAVMVLVHLEGSLRATAGTKRRQVKWILLGVGSLFAAYIYTMSQTILFKTITPTVWIVDSWAVIVANVLFVVSLFRYRLGTGSISLSQTTVYNSLTIVLVGSYLLAIGGFAKLIRVLGGNHIIPLGTFFGFAALVGLAMLLLSDHLRLSIKRFVSRHVYKTRHDYRHVWMTFTQRTASIVDVKELCAEAARMVSDTFAVPSVTIWLWHEEAPETMRVGGSTVFADGHEHRPGLTDADMTELIAYLRKRQLPVDFATPPDTRGQMLAHRYADSLRGAYIRYAVPLMTGQEVVGLMTLHERLAGEPLTLEDETLLKTLADQAATSLHNLRLTQRLARTQQLAAFQTLSTFFVHDLKNLASQLSLTLKNLPEHYDNPAFREDTLRLIAHSVSKIYNMCGRLSLLTQQLEVHCDEMDLNELVRTTLAEIQQSLSVPLVVNLHPLPLLLGDREQLAKVLVNLVLNAHDAVDADAQGELRICTERRNGWAVLSVHDNGCGMSQEFIAHSLFQPFCTTKRQGLGIGLFQSKKIIEAHQGKIEVESQEGKGTTFHVLLRCQKG